MFAGHPGPYWYDYVSHTWSFAAPRRRAAPCLPERPEVLVAAVGEEGAGEEGARTLVCLLIGRGSRPGLATSPARVPAIAEWTVLAYTT